ncbi:hypothetical protein DWV29_20825 [Enterocloster asparagiformis]|uniref:Uncharacterized protein n=2 Tax=Enterocloster asparagiformis TaxID=333367 RepID=C0D720_9FIRM|nr:hypothetical protein CLOSTASPAR_05067 [[Clostridium] asparagiforme DSM 15981]RGX25719.1 hypothetical protein DWV29_20825 [Enterocloster asparagiformis]
MKLAETGLRGAAWGFADKARGADSCRKAVGPRPGFGWGRWLLERWAAGMENRIDENVRVW